MYCKIHEIYVSFPLNSRRGRAFCGSPFQIEYLAAIVSSATQMLNKPHSFEFLSTFLLNRTNLLCINNQICALTLLLHDFHIRGECHGHNLQAAMDTSIRSMSLWLLKYWNIKITTRFTMRLQ